MGNMILLLYKGDTLPGLFPGLGRVQLQLWY